MNQNSDIPVHLSQIHIRAVAGCPICYVAGATSFEDLRDRLDKAIDMTNMSVETEREVLLAKLNA